MHCYYFRGGILITIRIRIRIVVVVGNLVIPLVMGIIIIITTTIKISLFRQQILLNLNKMTYYLDKLDLANWFKSLASK